MAALRGVTKMFNLQVWTVSKVETLKSRLNFYRERERETDLDFKPIYRLKLHKLRKTPVCCRLTMFLTDSPGEQLHGHTDELNNVIGSLIDIGSCGCDQTQVLNSIADLVLCQPHHLNMEWPTQVGRKTYYIVKNLQIVNESIAVKKMIKLMQYHSQFFNVAYLYNIIEKLEDQKQG